MAKDEFNKIYVPLALGALCIAAGINLLTTPNLEKKLDELKPIVKEEQVIGNQIPEKFYEIDGKKVYLEIDGKPVEEYFTEK